MRRELIYIQPFNREFAFIQCLISVLAILGYIVVLATNIIDHTLIGIAFIMVAIVNLLLGIAKIVQPVVSYELDETGIIYHHLKGDLLIRWIDVQRVDIPRINDGLNTKEIAYLGVKLKTLDNMLEESSVRLLSNLVTEIRPTAFRIIASEFAEQASQYLERLLDPSPYKSEKRIYKGVQAMAANQMATINAAIGFHILLPINSFDRSPERMRDLLNQYRRKCVG